VSKAHRLAALLLLVAALALALLGQYYFAHRREYLADGIIFWGLAALCFVLAWRQATAPLRPTRTTGRRSPAWGIWLRERPIPAALLAAGLFLSLSASLLSGQREWNQATNDVVLLWGLGLLATTAAALWPVLWPPWHGDWRAALRRVSRETWLDWPDSAGAPAAPGGAGQRAPHAGRR